MDLLDTVEPMMIGLPAIEDEGVSCIQFEFKDE